MGENSAESGPYFLRFNNHTCSCWGPLLPKAAHPGSILHLAIGPHKGPGQVWQERGSPTKRLPSGKGCLPSLKSAGSGRGSPFPRGVGVEVTRGWCQSQGVRAALKPSFSAVSEAT